MTNEKLYQVYLNAYNMHPKGGAGRLPKQYGKHMAGLIAVRDALSTPPEVVTLLETLPAEPTPEMIAAVSTILQPYAAKLVWQRMVLAARSPLAPSTQEKP